MKIKTLLAVAAGAFLLTACGPQGKNLDQISDATPGDSMVYYFGQLRAAEYNREAERDTTLKTKQAKEDYLQGVEAGMAAFKSGNEAYNRGLFMGMQMATNIEQFKTDYDVNLSKKVFVEALANVLMSDSTQDLSSAQGEFYRLMNQFNEQKEKRDSEAANAAVAKEAQKLKLAKISDTLYGGATDKKDGAQIKDGDDVTVDVKLSHPDGKAIDLPIPSSLKVGSRSLPEPLTEALKALKSGESGKFVTSAQALFGQRSSQFNLKPADVVVITAKATIDPAPEGK